jgi:hypothetical protein
MNMYFVSHPFDVQLRLRQTVFVFLHIGNGNWRLFGYLRIVNTLAFIFYTPKLAEILRNVQKIST